MRTLEAQLEAQLQAHDIVTAADQSCRRQNETTTFMATLPKLCDDHPETSLDGVRNLGIKASVADCYMTERAKYLAITAPELGERALSLSIQLHHL